MSNNTHCKIRQSSVKMRGNVIIIPSSFPNTEAISICESAITDLKFGNYHTLGIILVSRDKTIKTAFSYEKWSDLQSLSCGIEVAKKRVIDIICE